MPQVLPLPTSSTAQSNRCSSSPLFFIAMLDSKPAKNSIVQPCRSWCERQASGSKSSQPVNLGEVLTHWLRLPRLQPNQLQFHKSLPHNPLQIPAGLR